MSAIWRRRLKNAPGRVESASAVVGHIIYSFGGYCSVEDTFKRKHPIVVHSLDTNTLEWSLVPYTYDSRDDIPYNRYSHTVIADGHMIYLWGGIWNPFGENDCNVLFAFDSLTLKWSRPKVSGVTPDARDGHAATVCGRKMYIVGGNESEQPSQDVLSLDLDTFTWNHIVTNGMPPPTLFNHSLSCIDETLYVFGGRNEGPSHARKEPDENQIVCLDLRSLTWSRPVTKNAPIGRHSHSAFVFNKCLYIFGGARGMIIEDKQLNDLHMYNPLTKEWTKVSTRGAPPCPRKVQCCNLIESQLFLFGGMGRTGILTDFFVLDFSPSSETLAEENKCFGCQVS